MNSTVAVKNNGTVCVAREKRAPRPAPESVWINKANIQKYLPPARAKRVLVAGVTSTLEADAPAITSTRSRWDHSANRRWDDFEAWAEKKCNAYRIERGDTSSAGDPAGTAHIEDSLQRILKLNGGHGSAFSIEQQSCGQVLREHLGVPIRWRFNNDSRALVPSLLEELRGLIIEGIAGLEYTAYGSERRKSRATVLAVRKLLGFEDSHKYPDSVPFGKEAKSYEQTPQGSWKDYKVTRSGTAGNSCELICTGNNKNGFRASISFSFRLDDKRYRGKNSHKLVQLLELVDSFVGRGRKELPSE
jgi:hypothetical protein